MRRTVQGILAGVALMTAPLAFAPGALAAVSDLSEAYNRQTDLEFRKGLQMRLAWAGDYAGSFDGEIGSSSLRAIRDFQARHGLNADGVIDEGFLQLLISVSDTARESLGVSMVDDTATGIRIALPLALVRDLGRSDVGNIWRSADGGVEIETVRIADTGQTLDGLFDVLTTATSERSVTSSSVDGDSFVVSGEENGRSYHIGFYAREGDLRGFSASYVPAEENRMGPFLRVAATMLEPFASDPAAPLVAFDGSGADSASSGLIAEPARYALSYSDPAKANRFELSAATPAVATTSLPSPAPGDGQFDTSGTGFIVSHDGWLLTNAHVARSCRTILVGEYGAADKRIIDTDNDLALIHVEAALAEPLAISAAKPRLGEDILALGFPLRSILADSLNVTRGNVSSLMGLMNDPRYLQISAPVQPGNSGGPLVDLAGRVVGVVTAKLNAVAVADATGDIPQAINFAVRPDAAARFMAANGIAFQTADAEAELTSVPDATAKVKDAILPVLCLG